MPVFRSHATRRNDFVTQLTPFNVIAQAGRAPGVVSSALNQITGLYATAGWGTTEATRGKIWVQWTGFSSRGERPTDRQVEDVLRRAIRSAEATLGDGARLLLPGQSPPGRAAPSPPPPAAPPPAPSGAPEPQSAATSTGRRPSRRRSPTPPASEAEAEFIAGGGESAGSPLPDWVMPVAVIGGVTVVGAIGIFYWLGRPVGRVARNRRLHRSRARGVSRRLASNTHRSIVLEGKEGGRWIVSSKSPEVQRVLTSIVGRPSASRPSGGDGEVMTWRLDHKSRSLVWNTLRDVLRAERGQGGGLVRWADQRVYDFFSAERE